ncbi:MAG: hypothetical protein J6M53_02270 [Bacteroidaceae bacterium]|nr:hypothetical protein [Bacteroidaceae bacterium]
MKKYIKPLFETASARAEHPLCTPSDLTITRDSDKEVTSGWVRRQELWDEGQADW